MTRIRRVIPGLIALLGLAAFAAAPADAKIKRHHPVHSRAAATRPPTAFPSYVGTGIDRNPGTDNRYFSDTKEPRYIVGPAWFQRWNF